MNTPQLLTDMANVMLLLVWCHWWTGFRRTWSCRSVRRSKWRRAERPSCQTCGFTTPPTGSGTFSQLTLHAADLLPVEVPWRGTPHSPLMLRLRRTLLK